MADDSDLSVTGSRDVPGGRLIDSEGEIVSEEGVGLPEVFPEMNSSDGTVAPFSLEPRK
jgi:hypothetical protein